MQGERGERLDQPADELVIRALTSIVQAETTEEVHSRSLFARSGLLYGVVIHTPDYVEERLPLLDEEAERPEDSPELAQAKAEAMTSAFLAASSRGIWKDHNTRAFAAGYFIELQDQVGVTSSQVLDRMYAEFRHKTASIKYLEDSFNKDASMNVALRLLDVCRNLGMSRTTYVANRIRLILNLHSR